MNRGRPRKFDRDEALQRALDVFWEKGYQNTSIDDLLERMGIGRQSLYDTFGDKEALFCEVMQLYHRQVSARLGAILAAPTPPLDNIRRLFLTLVEKFGDGQQRGCLLVNTSMEFAASVPGCPVQTEVGRMFDELRRGFRETLSRAVAEGAVPKDFDVVKWATFFTAAMQGMLVMAKTGTTREQLQAVADGALVAIA